MSIKIPDSSDKPFELERKSPYETKNTSSSKSQKNQHKLKGQPGYERLSNLAKERISPEKNKLSPQKDQKEKASPQKTRYSNPREKESPVKKRLFEDPEDQSLEKPILPSAIQKDIKDYAKLFHASRELTKTTKNHPLNPKVGDHANEVYLTKPSNETEGVVFKTNAVAEKAVACSGLARLVGLGKSIPPAKISTASVSGNVQYIRLSVKGSSDILVDPEAMEKVENIQRDPNTKVITCETEAVNIKLIPEGNYYKAEIESSEETPSSFETAVKGNKKFVKLTDEEEMSFLAPETEIFNIESSEGSDSEYVIIDRFTYQIVQDDDGSITLKIPPKLKQKSGAEVNHALLEEGVMVKLNMEDPDDPEELSEVLTFESSIVSPELDEEEPEISFTHEGKEYKAELKDGKYSISKADSLSIDSPSEDSDDNEMTFDEQGRKILSKSEKEALGEDDFPFDENDKLQLCHDNKGAHYLVSQEDSLPLKLDGTNEFVEIDGKKYSPNMTKSGKIVVIGESIRGMIQSLVTNTFTHPEGAKDLNITHPSPAREAFFQRIDMPSFIDSFILTILIRPQDGKVINLEQSNVLFQAIEDNNHNKDPQDPNVKLRPVLIDLDETLPQKNGYSVDKQFTDDGLKDVHSVRCGLMGFPQARATLKPKEKEHTIALLKDIVSKKDSISEYLSKFGAMNISSVDSTTDIIDKIEVFLAQNKSNPQKDWTLEDLFFAVIPGYKKQWDLLGIADPALKASRIGLESEKTLNPKTNHKDDKGEGLKIHV